MVVSEFLLGLKIVQFVIVILSFVVKLNWISKAWRTLAAAPMSQLLVSNKTNRTRLV